MKLSIRSLKTTTVVLFVAIMIFSLSGCLSKYEDAYQHDMDIARLNDIKTIGELIEEYKEVTGKYPLDGYGKGQWYVHIATSEQIGYAKKASPKWMQTIPVKEFIEELEEGLDREVTLPFDPQRVAAFIPNFYIYMTDGNNYYLAIHLYHGYPFAKQLGEHYYKFEVSNLSVPSKRIWLFNELISDAEYKAAAAKKPNKPGYVEQLRDSIRNEGKAPGQY